MTSRGLDKDIENRLALFPSEIIAFMREALPAGGHLRAEEPGQTWHDAVRQYRATRSPNAQLFSFKRMALVHFAADVNEVYMTTQLKGEKTFFLPFNRGSSPL